MGDESWRGQKVVFTQDELRRMAEKQGMRTLKDEAINLVALDTTTISEVMRTAYAG